DSDDEGIPDRQGTHIMGLCKAFGHKFCSLPRRMPCQPVIPNAPLASGGNIACGELIWRKASNALEAY
ncbi:MAG: hypothetical protein Q8L22_08540, partial [Reyranella sp.]|nr:hypothetical protein [Reyranella sp.]